MRVKRLMAFLMTLVLVLSSGWNLAVHVNADVIVGTDSRIQGLRQADLSFTTVFTNEDLNLTLNTEGLDEGYAVAWTVGVKNADGGVDAFALPDGMTVTDIYTSTNTGITLHGAGLSKITHLMRESRYGEPNVFDIYFDITVEDEVVHSEWINGVLTDPVMEYGYPMGDWIALPHWGNAIDKSLEYVIWDKDHPEVERGTVQITDIKVETIEDYGESEEDPVVVEEWEDGNGWQIYTRDYGHAKVTLTHEDVQNEEEFIEYSFDIFVRWHVWDVQFSTDNGIQLMHSGESKEIYARGIHEGYNDNGDYIYENAENVEYVWEYADEANEEFLSISPDSDDPSILHIEAADNLSIAYDIELICKLYETDEEGNRVKDDEGNDIELAANSIWINITDEFTVLEPIYIHNVNLGDTLDIRNVIKPEVNLYKKGEDPKTLENISFKVEYDESVWEAATEDAVPALKRISTDGTQITLIAYETVDGEESEVERRTYNFDGLDHSIWLDDLQNGGWGYIFNDEEAHSFALNTDNLNDKGDNLGIDIRIGVWQGEGDDAAFNPLSPAESGQKLFQPVMDESDNLTGVELYPANIEKALEAEGYGNWFDIEIRVLYGTGEEQQVLHQTYCGIELCEAYTNYWYQYDHISMLPGWSNGLDKWFGYNMRDAEHPDGEDGNVEIRDIRVEMTNGENDAITVDEWEDGNGWEICANDFGSAEVTIKHTPAGVAPETVADSDLVEHTIYVDAWNDVWNMNVYSTTGTDNLLPGGKLDLNIDIEHHRYDRDEDGNDIYNDYWGNQCIVEYEWGYVDGANDELVDITQDHNVFHVTAKKNINHDDETRIWVRAYELDEEGNRAKDDEGNDIEVAYTEHSIYVMQAYQVIEPSSMDSLSVGSEIEFAPTLKGYYIDENGKTCSYEESDLLYRLEWDTNAFKISVQGTDENGKKIWTEIESNNSVQHTGPFKIERLKNWNSNIAFWIDGKNENGDYEEVYFHEFWFNEEQVISFKDLRQNDYTYVFADENDYVLELNADALLDNAGSLKDGLSIKWIVGQRDENGDFCDVDKYNDVYSVNSDGISISIDGTKLRQMQEAGEGIGGICVLAYVCLGDNEVGAYADTWVEITDEVYHVNAELESQKAVISIGNTVGLTTNLWANTYDTEKGEIVKTPITGNYVLRYEGYNERIVTVKDDKIIAGNVAGETTITVVARILNSNGDIVECRCPVTVTVIDCEHDWKEGAVLTKATCTAKGEQEIICKVCGKKDVKDIPVEAHTIVDIPGVAATETSTGLTTGKKCSVCGIVTVAQTVIAKLPPSHVHSYTYETNNDATVLIDGTKTGTCSCGHVVSNVPDEGSKLAATIKVPAKSFPMKVKQTYKGFAVTMGKGDSIVSVKSNKTSLVKVSKINKTKGTFTLTAQKKTGKAVVTITLASGKKQKLKITVQKKDVKTTKISGLKNVTLKKGKKTTLKPVITPITSKQKVKFKTSNKKVATVNAKGVVVAKKKGTAKITVTSGSKKKTIKVTVK